MKKTGTILTLILVLLLAAGCGGQEKDSGTTAEESAETSAAGAASSQAGSEGSQAGSEGGLTFTTTDRTGQTWDESAFSGHSLTMINLWEPWCGPCVREMPDLQKLQETYQDQGFQVLGVYSTPGMEAEVDQILADTGAQYPILDACAEFDRFQTPYVPTTFFVDGEGKVLRHALSPEEEGYLDGVEQEIAESVYIGARSYEEWAAIVEELL